MCRTDKSKPAEGIVFQADDSSRSGTKEAFEVARNFRGKRAAELLCEGLLLAEKKLVQESNSAGLSSDACPVLAGGAQLRLRQREICMRIGGPVTLELAQGDCAFLLGFVLRSEVLPDGALTTDAVALQQIGLQ